MRQGIAAPLLARGLAAGAALWSAALAAEPSAKDEAGMWMIVDRHEQSVRNSPRYLKDAALQAEIQRMACTLRSDLCDKVRVHLVRAPGFNASMAPNGAMYVQTGLLLRIENDSQLAAVVGHELSHFDRRHSIQNYRKHRRMSSGFAVVTALVGAASAVATAGATNYASYSRTLELSNTAHAMLDAARILSVFQLLAFSRGQESEADVDGIEWMADSPYSPQEALALWRNVAAESAAGGKEAGFSLLATHPAPKARFAQLSQLAEAAGAGIRDEPVTVTQMVGEHRLDWLNDEMQALSPEQFAHVADRQEWFGVPLGTINYYQGKAWQRHAKQSGLSQKRVARAYAEAIEAYQAGQALGQGFPAEGLSDLARCYLAVDDTAGAKRAFKAYLEEAPDAWDAKFVRRQLESL